jgi:HemY protein
MKWLISLGLILSAAVGFALFAQQDPGFVVIGRGAITIEMTLTIFLIVSLCGFGLIYFILRGATAIWRLPERWHLNRQSRMNGRAQIALQQGLSLLLQGLWQESERQLLRTYPQYLHYLSAAYAAHQRQDRVKRDNYLDRAFESVSNENRLSVLLMQAEFQILDNQANVALASLKQLREQIPRSPRVLFLLSQAYQQLENWQAVWQLLPDLKKRQVLSNADLQILEIKCAQHLIQQAAIQSAPALTAAWEKLPKSLRLQSQVAHTAAEQFIQQGLFEQAENLLYDALKVQWNGQLVLLYADLGVSNAAQQLNRTENWLKGREKDPYLLLALGRLSMRSRLWGKAQQYLEASLNAHPLAATYLTYGDLLSQLGETSQSAEYYRKGLMLRDK